MNTRTPESRQERKQRTRQDLLQAALRLLEDQSFSGLSLREVTREAGVVPTAFYRHFDNMEELGLALIDESFRTLREMIRAARADPSTFEHVIANSVEILVRHVHENRLHFTFIARERFSGVASIRHAIRTEIRLFASDLATDLVRFPYMKEWSSEDLHVMAGLIVNAMVLDRRGAPRRARQQPGGRTGDPADRREAAPDGRTGRADLAQPAGPLRSART